MKMIKRYVKDLDEELEGAQNYAEKYVEFKTKEDGSKWTSKFKAMAEDELRHAMTIHELIAEEIEKLRKVYTPPQDMLDKWDEAHREYVDRAAWLKQMMSL